MGWRTARLVGCLLASLFPFSVDASVACPGIDTEEAGHPNWTLFSTGGQFFATYTPASTEIGRWFDIPLDMDGPSNPKVLGWEQSDGGKGRFGALQYYSGATGTHISADITRFAIVDLVEGRLVALLQASVQLSGTRYREAEDGTVTELPINSCKTSTIEWGSDHMLHWEDGSATRYELMNQN